MVEMYAMRELMDNNVVDGAVMFLQRSARQKQERYIKAEGATTRIASPAGGTMA